MSPQLKSEMLSKPAFLPTPSLPTLARNTRSRTLPRPRRCVVMARYKVGVLDCRLPQSHSPTIRLRIYYPTLSPSSTPAPWLPSHPTPHDQASNILTFLSLPTPLHAVLRPVLTSLSQQSLPATVSPPIIPGALPPVLFSHGLGGSTGGYATFCSDLAARGRVVLAPEHSDGSAFIAHGEERVPYIRYNPAVHGPDRPLRRRQLGVRLADLRRVLACLDGGAFQPLERGAVAPQFSVDMAQLVIAGHSFGGATALLLAKELRPRKAVCLDAWLYPIENLRSLDIGSTDCLFVDMGKGMASSVARREELCRPSAGGVVDAVRVKGGLHNNSSDFPKMLPHWIAVMARMTERGSDPDRILQVQSEVVEKFLEGVEGWREWREGIDKDGEVSVAPVGRARSLAVVRR